MSDDAFIRERFQMEVFVSAKQMFAFWPVGTNQQMLLLTFPQADWHRTLPPVSFPSSQKLSRDSTGCLVETFCKSNRLVKRVQTLFSWPRRGGGLDIVLQVFQKTRGDPHSCRAVRRALWPVRLNAFHVAPRFPRFWLSGASA